MAENPESLNAMVTQQTGNDDAVEAMRRQIRVHDQTNLNKSALDKVVEVVWHKDDQTLNDLLALQNKVDADLKRGDRGAVTARNEEIRAAVKADQDAMTTQNSVEFYSGSFLKAAPLFAGRSKVLMAASIGFNALDAVKMKDNGGEVAADLAFGGFKGFALKKTFDVLGSKQFAVGAEGTALRSVSSIGGIGVKGIAIGGLSRLYDTGLNRENWVNANGEVDPLHAVSAATRAALDGRSMALDAGLFIGAHGVFSGLSRVGVKAIEASPFLQKLESSSAGSFIKDAKIIPSTTMGATFGFSSGAVGEVTRQNQAGESFDISKVLKRGALQALTDGAAGATGAGATRMTEMRVSTNIENAASGRQLGRAFAGEDVPPAELNGTGEKTDAVVPPERVETPVVPERVEPVVDETNPHVQEHTVDAALKPILEQAATLAGNAVQPGATAADAISFFKYAAGEGSHVKVNMEDVAKQAAVVGQTAMEALIKHGYETTPEVAATLDTGLSLAEAASRHGATAADHQAFFDYVYGQGRGAEVPLRVAAELSGDNAMDAIVQEAYAGAHQLQRAPNDQYRVSLNQLPKEAADVLRVILGNLPEDAQSHNLFRQNLHTWLDMVPQHQDVVKDYARQTRYGVVAAVVDAKLGTDYFSQFPERSLTSGNLLDKLKGLDHQRSVALEDVDATAVDGNNLQPVSDVAVDQPAAKPNPYEPAISHEPGRKVVNADRLIEEFYSSEGRGKQARAYLLSDFVSHMNDQQFADWYTYGMQPSGRADMPAGTTNFQLMRMPGLDVLERPEVVAALNDPEHAAVDLKTLKEFLSAPVKSSSGSPPAWQTEFIADRVELATQKLAMTEPPVGDGETPPPPVDPNKIVKEAVPSWFLKSIRDRFSTFDRNAGTATYPMEFDDHLAQMLENQRYLERQNPKYRESTPPSNSFADRVATLEKAIDIQQTTTAPELIPQLLKLGAADQPAVRGILDKLNLETNAPEYTEMLKIVVPRAENIQEVKTLLDAMYFGKKSDSNAFKARKDGKNADYAEKDRDANMALALTVAQKIAPTADAEGKRLQQIVTGVITGRIRDPRPIMDETLGRPGGPNGMKPGREREFRQRPNPVRDDRQERQGEVKPVVPEQTNQVVVTDNGSGNGDLNRTAGDGRDVTVSDILTEAANNAGAGETGSGTGTGIVHSETPVVSDAALANAGQFKVGEVDLTPVIGADGHITPVHQTVVLEPTHVEPTHVEPAHIETDHNGGTNKGVVGGSQRPDIVDHTEQDQQRQGRRQQTENFEDEDTDGGRDRRRSSKPKGKNKRDRGGANSQRWQRGFGDDDE